MTKKTYRNRVTRMTKNNIKDEGIVVNEGFSIDHIFPVSVGYRLNIPPELIADMRNIDIIPWRDNCVIKKDKCDSIPLYIQHYILGMVVEIKKRDSRINRDKGIEMAKQNGAFKGRKPGTKDGPEKFLNKPKVKEAIKLMKSKMKNVEISKILNINPNTLTKIKKYMKEYPTN
jgi:DNA invertase Pin-like site-specific DNA recombinase